MFIARSRTITRALRQECDVYSPQQNKDSRKMIGHPINQSV